MGSLLVDLEGIIFVEQFEIEQLVRHSTDCNTNGYRLSAALDFACLVAELAFDDSSDDNGDNNGFPNQHRYGPKTSLSCLARSSARSWQCGGQGFESP